MRHWIFQCFHAAVITAIVLNSIAVDWHQVCAQDAEVASLSKPQWKVGDSWQIDTVTQKVQGREEQSAGMAGKIRWKFKVAAVEKIGDRNCWRVEVECLAKGRLKPASKIWVDQETFFLRQFETQLPVAGALRTVQETYQPSESGHSPVLPPVNVLPVSLPAFLASSPKGVFKYTSQPTSKSKEVGQVRFAHSVTQQLQSASPKSLSFVPGPVSKTLAQRPVVEVHLGSGEKKVMQLWQSRQPWPVYSSDGNTQSWLVIDSEPGK